MPYYYPRLFALALAFRLVASQTTTYLRASDTRGQNLVPKEDSINLCFCESCTSEVANTVVDGYSCATRIAWLQMEKNMAEIDACRRIAGHDFPDECGACNPDLCQVQPICQVETCTMDVLATEVCDSAFGGCHHCGEQIRYLVASHGLSTKDACEKVAYEQFPAECGKCSNYFDVAGTARMDSLTAQPTPPPTTPKPVVRAGANRTAKPYPPTATPSPNNVMERTASSVATSNSICGAATCTQSVWDTLACNDNLGGCHTCGSRIDYLINALAYSPTDACEQVGFSQFSTECGGCRPDSLRPPVPGGNLGTLLWSDEFSVNGVPDPTKWTYDVGGWGWGNNELQHYTDRIDNAYVMDGILYIRAVRESYGGNDYTSARIKTKGFGDWTSGRIQVRARLARGAGLGTWAAAWMLPTDQVYGPWPASGEIDIMEHVGYEPGVFHGTVHTGAFNHLLKTQSANQMWADWNAWHTHEVIWTADHIDFLLDDVVYHTFRRQEFSTSQEWPFDQRFHLILNMAVGGMWGGANGLDENAFIGEGQIMEVDWVRVYSV